MRSAHQHISIHALLAESDGSTAAVVVVVWVFLSTLSLRRATYGFEHQTFSHLISIHALLAESDEISIRPSVVKHAFLSTLSLRRATARKIAKSAFTIFLSTLSLRRATVRMFTISGRVFGFLSTLSLRRATRPSCLAAPPTSYFYPRSPCGERRQHCRGGRSGVGISIHALLAESDQVMRSTWT